MTLPDLDDAFPNIDTAEMERNGKKVCYPDHGEIWSHPFRVIFQSPLGAVLEWESSRFGYRYEKRAPAGGKQSSV